MSKFRWAKMWWQDWSDDPALRLCSLAAQGLWMRMLCIAALQNDDQYGYVLVAGKPPTTAQLARITGAHHVTIKALLVELESNHVLSKVPAYPEHEASITRARGEHNSSKAPSGTFYCRRMIREQAIHKARKIAGKKGGNPTILLKQTVNHLEAEAESEAEAFSPQTPRKRGAEKTQANIPYQTPYVLTGQNAAAEVIRKWRVNNQTQSDSGSSNSRSSQDITSPKKRLN